MFQSLQLINMHSGNLKRNYSIEFTSYGMKGTNNTHILEDRTY